MAYGESGKKRGTSLPFVIFRILLSLIIFGVLCMGLYAAYKQFSGVDPLKVDPKALVNNFLSVKSAASLISGFFKDKDINVPVLNKIIPKVIPVEDEASTVDKDADKKIVFSYVLVADSHNENDYLKKALAQAKGDLGDKLQFVIGLGDYTEVGTLIELKDAKKVFDQNGIRYFVTSGDHDLWDGRDKQSLSSAISNYESVFGPPYQMFTHENVVFLILYNSDNYLGLGTQQREWLDRQLGVIKTQYQGKLVFVFLHEPLYHLSSNRIMGKVKDELKTEAKELIIQLKEAGVKEVFAGDIHFFTKYQEPNTGLNMTTVGAVTSSRNAQSPRFAVVHVYDDGTYSVEDVEIK